MSKKFSRHAYYDEDYEINDRSHMEDIKQRRRMKKLNNAIKSKNIDYLMHLDDED